MEEPRNTYRQPELDKMSGGGGADKHTGIFWPDRRLSSCQRGVLFWTKKFITVISSQHCLMSCDNTKDHPVFCLHCIIFTNFCLAFPAGKIVRTWRGGETTRYVESFPFCRSVRRAVCLSGWLFICVSLFSGLPVYGLFRCLFMRISICLSLSLYLRVSWSPSALPGTRLTVARQNVVTIRTVIILRGNFLFFKRKEMGIWKVGIYEVF